MSSKRARTSSEELGFGEYEVQYNPRTGRPIRRSANRQSLHTTTIESEDDLTGPDSDWDASDNEFGDDDAIVATPAASTQNLRPLEPCRHDIPDFPIIRDELGTIQHNSTSNVRDATKGHPKPDVLRLSINIPLGFSGPLDLNIAYACLLPPDNQPRTESDKEIFPFASSHPSCRSHDHMECNVRGWPDLPAEIRNRVYRFLFVQDETFDFYQPSNFKSSSQFLRTCKQVHSEGREILYSENSFTFERNKQTRQPFWTMEPKEMGWMDVRLFLTMIGERSLTLLRDVTFICDDAIPSSTRELTHEERRFSHDPNLIECMRLIGERGRLRRVQFSFHGRKKLLHTDSYFLGALQDIKADEVHIIGHPRWKTWNIGSVGATESKLSSTLKAKIEAKLTRTKKLYSA